MIDTDGINITLEWIGNNNLVLEFNCDKHAGDVRTMKLEQWNDWQWKTVNDDSWKIKRDL